MQKNQEGSKKNFKLYNLVAAALLTAVSVALAPLNLMIPLFGANSLRFTINDIPVFLSGALFGPAIGAVTGFIADILGYFIAPNGAYFPGFTLSKMLMGAIPGIIFYAIRKKGTVNKKLISIINIVFAVFALIGAAFYLNVAAIEDTARLGSIGNVPVRFIITAAMPVMVVLMGLIIAKIQKMLEAYEGIYKLSAVVLAVSVTYIIVNMTLSPIWVNRLYNVPVALSVIARIFKSLIEVPVQVTVIYSILQAIPVKVRQKILC